MKSVFAIQLVCIALSPLVAKGARIIPTPEPTAHWGSIRSATVGIPVVLPQGCDSATLKITNLAGRTVVDETFDADATYSWDVFSGAEPQTEDFFTLTLVGMSGGTVLSSETGTLALVKGAFGAVEARLDPSSSAWGKAGDNLVLPYSCKWCGAEAATAALEISKVGQTAVSAELRGTGWFGKRLRTPGWDSGSTDLSLAVADSEWTATVERMLASTVLYVR